MSIFADTERKIEEWRIAIEADKLLVITDSNVNALAPDFLEGISRCIIEAGEPNKSLSSACRIWGFFIDNKALRNTLTINLGGGMVSDLGGFSASTYKRGIPYINVPTTLLSAVDASTGGKTGINYHGLKNEVGTFAMPIASLPLFPLFQSLPQTEWMSGVGEAVKTGLLSSNELFSKATSNEFIKERNPDIVKEVVEECIAFKTTVVADDFREKGRRKILNLGHTAGHAIEELLLEEGRPIPHGIAVAHGITVALENGVKLGVTPQSLLSSYKRFVNTHFPPLKLSDNELKRIAALINEDKKAVADGTATWVLLAEPGKPILKEIRSTHVGLDSLK